MQDNVSNATYTFDAEQVARLKIYPKISSVEIVQLNELEKGSTYLITVCETSCLFHHEMFGIRGYHLENEGFC